MGISCMSVGCPYLRAVLSDDRATSRLRLYIGQILTYHYQYSFDSGLHMAPRRSFLFRTNILIFAGVLALQAAWLLAAALARPTLPYFPRDKADEERAAAFQSAAVTAASIGWVRGDLWTDAAIALSSGFINDIAGDSSPPTREPTDWARLAAERAARLSPHDSRIWLLLAALDFRLGSSPRGDIANRLKMSYYTGPNETELTPLRLRIVTRSTAITDPEMQILVAQEIRTIILRHQDQKPAIVAAYRGSSSTGKQFIEATVNDLDKNLLAALRASNNRL